MSGDLWLEAMQKADDLDRLVAVLRRDGAAYAEARRAYQVRLARVMHGYRGQGVAAALCRDYALGEESVADLRYARDIAEAAYKATAEAINVTKLQLRVIAEQHSREWAQAGRL
jgi:hypothetical protein